LRSFWSSDGQEEKDIYLQVCKIIRSWVGIELSGIGGMLLKELLAVADYFTRCHLHCQFIDERIEDNVQSKDFLLTYRIN
jgi:hypothetical protein